MYSLPDGFKIDSGEMVYWGARTLMVQEDGKAELDPSMNMTKAEVLNQLEILLEGKGWDEWIKRERAEL